MSRVDHTPPGDARAGYHPSEAVQAERRARMVREQLQRRGIRSKSVLEAMARVPRERFVSADWADVAYSDRALPIAHDQTISQPYIVALMTELAAIESGARVLEVGTGSGYQTAVLAALGGDVHTIEIVPALAGRARKLFEELGISVHTRVGDGHAGWPEAAPFDAIMVTAAPTSVPLALREQLAIGGRLVVPVGDEDQQLFVIRRTEGGYEEKQVVPVRFVPMTGGASFTGARGFDTL